ncbi:VanZ family protein [Demequina globuliformis]|uniref:VanZ family protein n=1 Tax=Demequina globuliformis TaxID=676202 RepID=UPI000A7AE35C|nr:VanZ family protein [Demequina globuliformis]
MSQVLLAVLAVGGGLVVFLGLFVPFLGLMMRRRGAVSFRAVAIAVATLVYFIALWTYTLVPLPEPDSIVCAGPAQLDPLAFVDDLTGASARGHFLSDPAFLQLALNVLLFVPLGVFVRVVVHRGMGVAAAAGAAVSLLIETTQITGVWGLYPCAYRLFDVDDLLTNTLGAVLGCVVALAVPPRWREPQALDVSATVPRPVTRGRRLLSMIADFVVTVVLSFATAIVAALVITAAHAQPSEVLASPLVTLGVALVPLVATTVFFTATGTTWGQAAMLLRYDVPGGLGRPRQFLVLLGGIGGYQLLALLPPVWFSVIGPLFCLASLIFTLATPDGRGLPGLLSRAAVVDARAPGAGDDHPLGGGHTRAAQRNADSQGGNA